MSSLEDDFEQLLPHWRETQHSTRDPFYYFVYAPDQALTVKAQLPVWIARLHNDGITAERVSFSDLLWEIVDASGHWQTWLDYEDGADQHDVNESVRDVLRLQDALVGRVAALVAERREKTVVFLTDTEMLHPYFRVRTLESVLHDRIRIPLVVLYPGRRVGQFGLHFLGFYPEDPNYRATLIGGLA